MCKETTFELCPRGRVGKAGWRLLYRSVHDIEVLHNSVKRIELRWGVSGTYQNKKGIEDWILSFKCVFSGFQVR